MRRYSLIVIIVLGLSVVLASLCMAQDPKRELNIRQAKRALIAKKIALEDLNIIYDENNRQWEAWGNAVAQMPNDPNYGNLSKGELKDRKYQAIYFDFIDDAKKDIWVFVDADTGDVLAIYVKK